jgi:hypothetical protein
MLPGTDTAFTFQRCRVNPILSLSAGEYACSCTVASGTAARSVPTENASHDQTKPIGCPKSAEIKSVTDSTQGACVLLAGRCS